jgi:uncharacterized protein YuzE
MKVEHDLRHDTAYVTFAAGVSVRQVALGGGRVVDYAADGSVLGVEFLAPSQGLDLDGLPRPAEVARAARRLGLRILPSRGAARAG